MLHEDDNEPLVRAVVRKEECPFEKGSAMALLWQQQKTASHFKKSTSMRWHPVIIRWAYWAFTYEVQVTKLYFHVYNSCQNEICFLRFGQFSPWYSYKRYWKVCIYFFVGNNCFWFKFTFCTILTTLYQIPDFTIHHFDLLCWLWNI